MSGSLDLAASCGGILELLYSETSFGPVYSIHLAVTAFNPTPTGLSNDYAYTGMGGFSPAEAGLLATFANLAACWQPYYPPSWAITLNGVYQNVGGTPTPLSVVPTTSPIVGSASVWPLGGSRVKRSIACFSQFNRRWRIWLRQLPAQAVAVTIPTYVSSGGFDANDQAWFAYLASSRSGVVGADGTRFQSAGSVRAWWDTPVAPYLISG